ncbi:hypothetical protein [Roseovarius indicus]|nr:hypothetical protein [Roseovarius indicus]
MAAWLKSPCCTPGDDQLKRIWREIEHGRAHDAQRAEKAQAAQH